MRPRGRSDPAGYGPVGWDPVSEGLKGQPQEIFGLLIIPRSTPHRPLKNHRIPGDLRPPSDLIPKESRLVDPVGSDFQGSRTPHVLIWRGIKSHGIWFLESQVPKDRLGVKKIAELNDARRTYVTTVQACNARGVGGNPQIVYKVFPELLRQIFHKASLLLDFFIPLQSKLL